MPGPAAAEAAIDCGTPPHRVIESINSLDAELFGRKVRELRTTASGGSVHRFVFVGRLIGLKNVENLIRAFAMVQEDAVLEIAGDGLLLDDLRSIAAQCGVADRVRFHGFLDEDGILQLLARSHTLALPSTREVFGFAALEGYVAGLHVIVSRHAGISRNLDGRKGIWVVDPTVEELARAMKEAQSQWEGWQDDVDVEFVAPRRVARDIMDAARIARGPGTD